MMGSKGGGKADTSGIEAATAAATALQKQIYEETRKDVQPWYQMGTGAVSKLSDLLGIGGGSVQNRDQIYQQLLPQYTGQTTTTGSNMFVDANGNVKSADYFTGLEDLGNNLYGNAQNTFMKSGDKYLQRGGSQAGGYAAEWSPLSSTQGDVVDYEALNAAVNAQMGGQATPAGYGSLLESFDMNKFSQDPSYKFRQDEAQKALERQMAAQGITLGGGGGGNINPQAYEAMTDLSQNLASQEYGNSYNRYVNDQLNTFNMLMGASGAGQTSTGQMAAGGQNYATNVGNLTTGLASAQLNAQQANQSSGGSMFGQLLGVGAGALLGNPALGAAAGKALFG